jgi:hypothetical protein
LSLASIFQSPSSALEFVARGYPAAEELLEAIRSEKHVAVGQLEGLLVAIRAPALVDLYAPLIARDDRGEARDVLLGLRLLGATADERALPHLVGYLEDRGRLWRDRAAVAIAELAVPAGRAALVAHARELLGDDDLPSLADRCAREYEMRPLRALIEIAIGLARLGDHSLAYVPITLVSHRYPRRTDRIEQMAVRIEAASALKHVVGDGLRDAIAACIRGGEVEAARHGAFAAFLVGTRAMVPLLVEAGRKRDHELRNNAPIWLHRLFARDGEYRERSASARAKWLAAQEFPEGVVLRMGKPRDEREVVELLKTPFAHDALRELSITLGDLGALRDFDARDQPVLHRRALERLAEGSAEPGILRRHNHPVPMTARSGI